MYNFSVSESGMVGQEGHFVVILQLAKINFQKYTLGNLKFL